MSESTNRSRRDFLKKTAYVVPVILTLKAAPSLAGTGSPHKPHDGDHHGNGYQRHNKKGGSFNFFSKLKSIFKNLF
ncbi:MAG: hypothetical protein IT489_02105 [Gammaproteobacteria bacterium]|nr:hypothetical protein [Gammaproteobacteria bacterium]